MLFQPDAALNALAPGSVDLVVTSPPYPMIEMWDASFGMQDSRITAELAEGNGPEAFELMHRLLDTVWSGCMRVLRPGGFACINIGDATRTLGAGFRLYCNHSRVTTACEKLGFQSLPLILWRKQTNAPNKFMGSGMLPAGAYVTLEHEYILVLRKGGKRVFDATEKQQRARSAFFWEERNSWFSDIWDFKGVQQRLPANEARKRSGAFPFELAFRLIHMYSMQQDLVLDPFVGSGTTTVAALAAGRSSLGLELQPGLQSIIEATIADASQRINDRQLQRLYDHERFVHQYRASRGHEPQYRNEPHGFAVVTRQEQQLVLPAVTGLQRVDELHYRADHGQLEPHSAHVLTRAAGSLKRSQQAGDEPGAQLGLWAADQSPAAATRSGVHRGD